MAKQWLTALTASGIILLNLAHFAPAAWAHGEDKPGPHGGVIRMPGAFHTELQQLSDRELSVHLLDLHWKNPVVKDSRVEALLKRKASRSAATPIACIPEAQRFRCPLPSGVKLVPGDRIELKASRMGQAGALVTYEFPFQPTKAAHDGH